ncbi:MAG: hypothetical protein H7Y17_07615 [Chlorobia bacterium]|nr:hypothetical protein [Fimbriimonadaceae bacterium]
MKQGFAVEFERLTSKVTSKADAIILLQNLDEYSGLNELEKEYLRAWYFRAKGEDVVANEILENLAANPNTPIGRMAFLLRRKRDDPGGQYS